MWTRLVWWRLSKGDSHRNSKPNPPRPPPPGTRGVFRAHFEPSISQFELPCGTHYHQQLFTTCEQLFHATSCLILQLNSTFSDHLEKFPSWLLSGTMGAAQPSTPRCTPPQEGPSRRLASTRSWSSSASTVWGTSVRWARGQMYSAAPAPQASSCASWGVS